MSNQCFEILPLSRKRDQQKLQITPLKNPVIANYNVIVLVLLQKIKKPFSITHYGYV